MSDRKRKDPYGDLIGWIVMAFASIFLFVSFGWLFALIVILSWKSNKSFKYKLIVSGAVFLIYGSYWGPYFIYKSNILKEWYPYSQQVLESIFSEIDRGYYFDSLIKIVRSFFSSTGSEIIVQKTLLRFGYVPYIWWLICGPLSLVSFCVVGFFLLNQSRNRYKGSGRRQVEWIQPKRDVSSYINEALEKNVTLIGFNVRSKKGENLSMPVRNGGVHIIGGPGSGKTLKVIVLMAIQDILSGRPLVILEGKGSLTIAKILYHVANKCGRSKDFYFLSATDIVHSNTYNPLLLGTASEKVDKFMGFIDGMSKEPYFIHCCKATLSILFDEFEKRGIVPTIQKIHKVLTCTRPPFPQLDRYLKSNKNGKDSIGTLVNFLEDFVRHKFAPLLDSEKPDIQLDEVYKKKKIVVFSINLQSLNETGARLGKIIMSDLNTLAGRVVGGEEHFDVCNFPIFVDELGAFGNQSFIPMVRQGRESGFCVTCAHQEIGDLRAISPEFPSQLMGCTNTKISLNLNDPDTAQEIAKAIGTEEYEEVTTQVQVEGESSKKMMGTSRKAERYFAHPQVLMELGPGKAVIKSLDKRGYLTLFDNFYDVSNISLPIKEPVIEQIAPECGVV